MLKEIMENDKGVTRIARSSRHRGIAGTELCHPDNAWRSRYYRMVRGRIHLLRTGASGATVSRNRNRCGVADFTPQEIAPLFHEAISMENISLPKRFWEVLNKDIDEQ